MGLTYGKVNIKPVTPTWFAGNLDDLIGQIPAALEPGFSRLYFPLNPRFEDIDAAYVTYNAESNTLTVVAIQITISKNHKDSESLFYQKWDKWKQRFGRYNLNTTFLWIVENETSWKTVMMKQIKTRNNLYEMPEHGRAYITALKLYEPLGRELDRIRAMRLKGEQWNRPISLHKFKALLCSGSAAISNASKTKTKGKGKSKAMEDNEDEQSEDSMMMDVETGGRGDDDFDMDMDEENEGPRVGKTGRGRGAASKAGTGTSKGKSTTAGTGRKTAASKSTFCSESTRIF